MTQPMKRSVPTGPNHTTMVDVPLPEAVRLADLYEIESDLHFTVRLCTKVIETGDARSFDESVVTDGLIIAAVVKYARCFVEGVRMRLVDSDLAKLSPEDRIEHDYFMALRHRFVTHAVNGFEETFVTVGATLKDGQKVAVTALSRRHGSFALTAAMASRLLRLTRRARDLVTEMAAVDEAALLAQIQSLPVETVHSWKLNRQQPLHPDVERSRPRGVNAKQRTRGLRPSKSVLPKKSG